MLWSGRFEDFAEEPLRARLERRDLDAFDAAEVEDALALIRASGPLPAARLGYPLQDLGTPAVVDGQRSEAHQDDGQEQQACR